MGKPWKQCPSHSCEEQTCLELYKKQKNNNNENNCDCEGGIWNWKVSIQKFQRSGG